MLTSITDHRRGRALVSLTASIGLCLGVTAIASGPASSVGPAGDCAQALPVDQVVEGMAVTGLTVSHGTTPEGFTGEVLGVLDDGIGAGLDMVIVRLTSPEIDRVGGIWQGMSGSPVYAPDGSLIGAVAYGLAAGASPVAGVTPFAEMDDYLGAPARTVAVTSAEARTIARHSDVSAAQAAGGFEQLPMPLGVAGVIPSRLAGAAARADGHKYLSRAVRAMGTSHDVIGPETIVAGGNLAASISYGDIAQAGVGTATSVCNGRVVGFGHPFGFFGDTTLSLHPAEAIYVQEDLFAPFKLANLGEPVGTITDDRGTGITGTFGALPDYTTVTSTVTYGDRSRTGSSKVSVPMADALASTTFYELVANHDRVVDGLADGSELLTWTIAGTDTDGSPFEIGFTDRFASNFDLTYDVGFELGDIVFALGNIEGITIDSITSDSQFVDNSSTYRISSLQQYRDGAWVALGEDNPAVVRAGKKLIVRAVLVGGVATTAPVTFQVPERAAGSNAVLRLIGGSRIFSGGGLGSIARAQRFFEAQVRNDEIQATLGTRGSGFGGGTGPTPPTAGRARPDFEKSQVLGPFGRVVTGSGRVKVLIK